MSEHLDKRIALGTYLQPPTYRSIDKRMDHQETGVTIEGV